MFDDADVCQVLLTADCGVTGMMTGCVSTVTLCDMSASTEQVRRGELNIFHMMIEIHTPNVSQQLSARGQTRKSPKLLMMAAMLAADNDGAASDNRVCSSQNVGYQPPQNRSSQNSFVRGSL